MREQADMNMKRFFGTLLIILISSPWVAWAVNETNGLRFIAMADHPDGVYKPGEVIRWTISSTNGSTSNLVKSTYIIRKGGLTVMREGRIEFTKGMAEIAVTNAVPGTVLLEVKAQNADKRKAKGY